jgi:hypothetical protein
MVDRQRSVDSAITLAFRQLSHYPAPARARTSFQSWLSARSTVCLGPGCAWRKSRAYLSSQPKTQWPTCRDQWIPKTLLFVTSTHPQPPHECIDHAKAGRTLAIRYALDRVVLGVGLELTIHLNRRRNGRDAEISRFREYPGFSSTRSFPAPSRARVSLQSWQDLRCTVYLGRGCACRRS